MRARAARAGAARGGAPSPSLDEKGREGGSLSHLLSGHLAREALGEPLCALLRERLGVREGALELVDRAALALHLPLHLLDLARLGAYESLLGDEAAQVVAADGRVEEREQAHAEQARHEHLQHQLDVADIVRELVADGRRDGRVAVGVEHVQPLEVVGREAHARVVLHGGGRRARRRSATSDQPWVLSAHPCSSVVMQQPWAVRRRRCRAVARTCVNARIMDSRTRTPPPSTRSFAAGGGPSVTSLHGSLQKGPSHERLLAFASARPAGRPASSAECTFEPGACPQQTASATWSGCEKPSTWPTCE